MSIEEVLAAIDGSWRALKSAVESMTAAEMAAADPEGGESVRDVLSHVAKSEAALTRSLLDNDAAASDAGSGDGRAPPSDTDRPVAELITELDETHRALRMALRDAPASAFERGSPIRESIDRATTLHYYEHTIEIRRLTDEMRERTAQ